MSIRTVIDFSPLLETTIPCRIFAATASFSAWAVPCPAVLPCLAAARSLRRDPALSLRCSARFAARSSSVSASPALCGRRERSSRRRSFQGKSSSGLGSAASSFAAGASSEASEDSASGASSLASSASSAGGVELGSSPAACEDEESCSSTGPAASAPSSLGVSSTTSFFSSSLISSALSRRRSRAPWRRSAAWRYPAWHRRDGRCSPARRSPAGSAG